MKSLLAAIPLLVFPCGSLHAEDTGTQLKLVDAIAELTVAPALHPAEGSAADGGIKPVFYDALDWKGKPTRVFAWLGMPENRKGKVPGIVLVHGGGGTAFKEWVKRWNDRGYAAISIAVEGQVDVRDKDDAKAWQRHEWAGPARVGIYGDSEEPLVDQWMYHAVADTVLANSLLRSLPEVDAEKIGLMGISWGGVITSTVIGIDTRFAFAIPTYGCGHLFDADNQYGQALGNSLLYQKVWDPMVRMDRVKLPVLWFSWPEDAHFPMDCQAANYGAAKGSHMVSLIPKMRHGHGPPWTKPDSYAFAESIVAGGKPWCVQTAASATNQVASVVFASTKLLDNAILVSTTDMGVTGDRKWVETSAVLEKTGEKWSVTAPLPEGTTAWFLNVRSGDLTASSDFQNSKENP